MGWMFPYSATMRVIGGIILLSAIVNALVYLRTDWGSMWFFEWSPIFIFMGLLLLLGALWNDPRIVIVLAGLTAVLWYVFIVLGWSF